MDVEVVLYRRVPETRSDIPRHFGNLRANTGMDNDPTRLPRELGGKGGGIGEILQKRNGNDYSSWVGILSHARAMEAHRRAA